MSTIDKTGTNRRYSLSRDVTAAVEKNCTFHFRVPFSGDQNVLVHSAEGRKPTPVCIFNDVSLVSLVSHFANISFFV